MDEALIGLMAAIFGGAGLKVIEHYLSRGTAKVDVATELRNELRSEVTGLRDEIRGVERDLDIWKQKYYTLLDGYSKLKYRLIALGQDPNNLATEIKLKEIDAAYEVEAEDARTRTESG